MSKLHPIINWSGYTEWDNSGTTHAPELTMGLLSGDNSGEPTSLLSFFPVCSAFISSEKIPFPKSLPKNLYLRICFCGPWTKIGCCKDRMMCVKTSFTKLNFYANLLRQIFCTRLLMTFYEFQFILISQIKTSTTLPTLREFFKICD